MAGSGVFSSVMPCLSADLVARASNFGMPSSPSLLLQYSTPFGVLLGRCIISNTIPDGLDHGLDGGDGGCVLPYPFWYEVWDEV